VLKIILSNELYDKFVKMIYKETGLFFEDNKKYYVQKRIEKRAQTHGIDDLNDYYLMVKYAEDTSEFYKLINELTINETYFFRDFPQLRNFAEDILPVFEKENNAKKNIKIWCAACSTGEEAYTLAIILLEMLDNPSDWQIQILATDINSDVLKKAKIGLYDRRAVRDVPLVYLDKYFTKQSDKYQISQDVKKYITYREVNLMDETAMNNINGCDFIFCRNCLIYFDDESRKNVVSKFYNSLKPGGYLFLGPSESVGRISSAYKVSRMGDTIVYSRPK